MPPISTKDDDHDHGHFHLFMIKSHDDDLSNPSDHDPRQAHFTNLDDHHHKVKEFTSKGGNCSSSILPSKDLNQDPKAQISHHHSSNGQGWVSSMHKMITSSSPSDHEHDHNKSTSMVIKEGPGDDGTPHQQQISSSFTKNKNSTVIRVCSDCNTTSTPLWRSGPRGPKSLCNACGIRQRKARRAMAEASNGVVSCSDPPPPARAYNKEKKARTGLAVKKQQLADSSDPGSSNTEKHKVKKQQLADSSGTSEKNKQFLKDFAMRLSQRSTLQRAFPRDEEEAAFLLMEMSCGLVHT